MSEPANDTFLHSPLEQHELLTNRLARTVAELAKLNRRRKVLISLRRRYAAELAQTRPPNPSP